MSEPRGPVATIAITELNRHLPDETLNAALARVVLAVAAAVDAELAGVPGRKVRIDPAKARG